jgi:hypothetical protein
MNRAVIALILALVLASCASTRKEPAKSAAAPAPAQAQAGTTFGNFMTSYGATSAPVPPMEPGRLINEQDCSKGIEFTAGNLLCR